MKKTTLIAALLAFAVVLPMAAFALDDNYLNVPREHLEHLLSLRGKLLGNLARRQPLYEAEMLDKNGVRVETHVHPATGELLLGYDD